MAKKTILTWDDIQERLAPLDKANTKVYGVPRGGMIVAGFLRQAENVTDPEQADLILDDIIDSGRTKDRYRESFPQTPFVGLIDKQTGDNDMGWVVFPWEEEIGPEDAVIRLLEYLGEDSTREGLRDTPKRVIKSWDRLYGGYHQNPRDVLSRSFSSDGYDEMICLRDIEFYSMCEHHMLPFLGKAKVAYIPGESGRVVGISKLARLVECFARRLQIQERMTQQIAQTIEEVLEPRGVAVEIEAQHLCMVARGVEKQNSIMVTRSLLGAFRDQPATRQEFMSK